MGFLLIPIILGLIWLLLVWLFKDEDGFSTKDYHTKSDLEVAQKDRLKKYRFKQSFPVENLLLPSVYLFFFYVWGLQTYLVAILVGWFLFSILRVFPSNKNPRKALKYIGLVVFPGIVAACFYKQSLQPLQLWMSVVFIMMFIALLAFPKLIFGDKLKSHEESSFNPRLWFWPLPIVLLLINEYLRSNASDLAWLWFYHFQTIFVMIATVIIVPTLVGIFFKDDPKPYPLK